MSTDESDTRDALTIRLDILDKKFEILAILLNKFVDVYPSPLRYSLRDLTELIDEGSTTQLPWDFEQILTRCRNI